MGTWTSHEDTGDILKFVLKDLDIKNDFYNGWALSHLFNAGVFKRRAKDRNLSQLDLSFMNTDEIARALTMLSGSGDDIIDAEELMRALNHLLPGNPYQQDTDGIWYYGNSFSGEPLDDIYGFIRGTGFSEEKNGPRFRQAGLKEAIAIGKFYEFIKTRVPESSLPYLPGDPNYRGPRTASLAPAEAGKNI